jgi:ribosomal protein L11 methyltransferase
VPYWERGLVDSNRINVLIDPGPSFGAGNHPSTLICLELMEHAVKAAREKGLGSTVLDVGTGTGVLAIAAAFLGARHVVGFDTDSAGIYTARRNVDLNGLVQGSSRTPGTVALFRGSSEALTGSFSVVVANIAGPVLMRMENHLTSLSSRDIVLSGIAEEMGEMVRSAYTRGAFELRTEVNRDGWRGLWLCRRTKPDTM